MTSLTRINERGEREHLTQDGWIVVALAHHSSSTGRIAASGGTCAGGLILPITPSRAPNQPASRSLGASTSSGWSKLLSTSSVASCLTSRSSTVALRLSTALLSLATSFSTLSKITFIGASKRNMAKRRSGTFSEMTPATVVARLFHGLNIVLNSSARHQYSK